MRVDTIIYNSPFVRGQSPWVRVMTRTHPDAPGVEFYGSTDGGFAGDYHGTIEGATAAAEVLADQAALRPSGGRVEAGSPDQWPRTVRLLSVANRTVLT